ncbi:MAG: lysophospholipid acyltransferase family protein [Rhodospirillaceae bacterium]|nr:lysophospholipid acyltransferase family protein [Rhodospirillaceae bacterium]
MAGEGSSADRLWRQAMTGVCFAAFGVGGLFLSLAWFNILFLVQRDPRKRRWLARRSISASFRLFLRATRFLGVLDYRIDGQDLLRGEQGCLVVANHPTLIDYVLLASVMPETDCLVKSALLHNPFLRGVVRAADYLINSQAAELLPDCRQRLAAGNNILIFPEGTRTSPGKTMVLQRGAANIAVRCSSPLLVVAIQCSEHFLNKESRWHQVPARKPFFHVSVQERIDPETFQGGAVQEPSRIVRELNRYLAQRLGNGGAAHAA